MNSIFVMLISLHIIPVTATTVPEPPKYVTVAPSQIPYHYYPMAKLVIHVSKPPETSTYDTAPHTHAGLVAWLKTLPYPWPTIATCESVRDDSWPESSSSPARGVFQFLRSSWRMVGGTGDPAAASWREQFKRAKLLRKLQGINAWACARITGVS